MGACTASSPTTSRPDEKPGARKTPIDILVGGFETAELLDLLSPVSNMFFDGIMGVAVVPAAGTFFPAVPDPLRRNPKSPEAARAMGRVIRMHDVVVGQPVALRLSAAVELAQLFLLAHNFLAEFRIRLP
jgi:hypothetical protein